MFDFNNIKETAGLKFVGYGINNNVVVTDVSAGENQNGTPFIQIQVKFDGAEDKDSTTLKLYMSPGAKDMSMKKILHMHQAINKLDLLKSRKFNTQQELAQGLKAMWMGRKFRLKLSGEEYMGVDKEGMPKIKVKLNIPFAPFAEACTQGAEFPMIADDATKLTFDKSNKYDYKPFDPSAGGYSAAPQASTGGFAPSASTDDDMPF